MNSDSQLTTHDSPALLRNALTVDVEDYFHVSAFSKVISGSDWDHYEPRVEANTHRLLDIFDEHEVKATFFVLGWIADHYPALVKAIAARDHEISCHGYSHELIYNQNPETFRHETLRSKTLLEDIVQAPVYGYRAASFSITERSRWALEVLADIGFVYDSSIFPVRHDRYGIAEACTYPHRIRTPSEKTIIEFPLTTATIAGWRLPVAGGGYFRLYPYALTRLLLRTINGDHRPFVFYIHPWELDPEQPRIRANALSVFRHYNNLRSCEKRLNRLLAEFSFTTMKDALHHLNLWDAESRC